MVPSHDAYRFQSCVCVSACLIIAWSLAGWYCSLIFDTTENVIDALAKPAGLVWLAQARPGFVRADLSNSSKDSKDSRGFKGS